MIGPLRKNHPLLKIVKSLIIDLPAPSNLSIWWNFGSLLGLCLIIQMMTGLFLAMHYTPKMEFAFSSMSHISRDVNYGWLLRNIHTNTASFFFLSLYFHIGRKLYYGSYLKNKTWKIGVILFFITMATAFVGYVLPWGQMSFWGATVMTNLVSAIPYIGNSTVQWMWGGFSIDNATLTRFFTFHFLLPFIIAALSIIHIMFLHEETSNKPIGITSNFDKTPFHFYFTTKDLLGFIMLILSISIMVLLYPSLLKDPEKFNQAKPLITPIHIQPEWYFLFAYAILRSIPNKLGGVMALMSSIFILLLVPLLHTSYNQASSFRPSSQLLFWTLMITFFMLTWIGSQPVEDPFIIMGQISSILYFLMFLVISPFMAEMEKNITF